MLNINNPIVKVYFYDVKPNYNGFNNAPNQQEEFSLLCSSLARLNTKYKSQDGKVQIILDYITNKTLIHNILKDKTTTVLKIRNSQFEITDIEDALITNSSKKQVVITIGKRV